jgi:cellulose synthase/poly-beta-1,6-N-acetylglucosamine synthase-like glycosyltransferase
LDYPREKLQVIVAADGSTDGTVDIVKSLSGNGVILSFSPERRGKMAAVANAVKSASGDILVFSDANNFFTPYALKYLIQPFADVKIGGTTGSKHIRQEDDSLASSEGFYWKYESWIKMNESRLNTCSAAAGEIFALRREYFPGQSSGVINDDFFILLNILRKGNKVIYVPQAESWERISQSSTDEVKRRSRITAGRFQALSKSLQWMPWNDPLAVWQIISHKYFRLLIPFAMILALLANIWLVAASTADGLAGELYKWLLILQIAFYALAGLGQVFSFKGIWKVFYLPAFLVNSNIATLRGFLRHFQKKQDTRWEKVNRR